MRTIEKINEALTKNSGVRLTEREKSLLREREEFLRKNEHGKFGSIY